MVKPNWGTEGFENAFHYKPKGARDFLDYAVKMGAKFVGTDE